MDYTGRVFEKHPTEIAGIEIEAKPNYLEVGIIVSETKVMMFPLPLDSDINSINSRIRNIINQTGLVENSVVIELELVE